eukprot:s1441_g13.t1
MKGGGKHNEEILGEFFGVVKSYNPDKGFGFIACDALKGQHGDVYLNSRNIGDFKVGQEVKFQAFLHNGRPQGRDLRDATGRVGPQSGAAPGAEEQELGVFAGKIKNFNQEKGFGFIVCDALATQGFQGDVFLHQKHKGEFKEGDYVAFMAVLRNGKWLQRPTWTILSSNRASALTSRCPLPQAEPAHRGGVEPTTCAKRGSCAISGTALLTSGLMERWLSILSLERDQLPNSVEVTWFDDARDARWLSDDESLFRTPTQDIHVICVALGGPRLFRAGLRCGTRFSTPVRGTVSEVTLSHGDTCVMEGRFQKHFVHQSVGQQVESDGSSSNEGYLYVTFRWIAKHSRNCPHEPGASEAEEPSEDDVSSASAASDDGDAE